jgi:hypothetical protein
VMPRMVTVLAVMAASVAPSAMAQSFETAMASWGQSVERAVSALKIDTRQESLSTRQVSVSEHGALKAMASSMGQVDRALAVRAAQQRYEETMQTAVGGACADVAANRLAQRADETATEIRERLRQQERDWNSDGGNRVSVMAGTQSVRESAFCSAEEAAAGLCVEEAHQMVGTIPAGDSNAAPFLLRSNNGQRSYGNIEAQAGLIYMDNLLPMPTMPSVAEAHESGNEARLLRAEAMRQQALISMRGPR